MFYNCCGKCFFLSEKQFRSFILLSAFHLYTGKKINKNGTTAPKQKKTQKMLRLTYQHCRITSNLLSETKIQTFNTHNIITILEPINKTTGE